MTDIDYTLLLRDHDQLLERLADAQAEIEHYRTSRNWWRNMYMRLAGIPLPENCHD